VSFFLRESNTHIEKESGVFFSICERHGKEKKKGQNMTKSHEKQKNYRAVMEKKRHYFSHALKRPRFGMWLFFFYYNASFSLEMHRFTQPFFFNMKQYHFNI